MGLTRALMSAARQAKCGSQQRARMELAVNTRVQQKAQHARQQQQQANQPQRAPKRKKSEHGGSHHGAQRTSGEGVASAATAADAAGVPDDADEPMHDAA